MNRFGHEFFSFFSFVNSYLRKVYQRISTPFLLEVFCDRWNITKTLVILFNLDFVMGRTKLPRRTEDVPNDINYL